MEKNTYSAPIVENINITYDSQICEISPNTGFNVSDYTVSTEEDW